jgi:drug/metabolite transporter (DMT)-like permease
MADAAHVRPFGPRILAQFGAAVLIWGSTWIVIRSQLGVISPSWAVAYRFLIASAVLLAVVLARGETRAQLLRIGRRGHGFAIIVGIVQFSLNFNLVYRAEQHLTSGLVALSFGLLLVPNAVLGHFFLGQHITRRFAAGSVIAMAGLVLLFARDLTAKGGQSADVMWGLAMCLAATGFASIGNVLQATSVGRSLPAQPALALAMAYGGLINAGFAWATAGPPTFVWTPTFVGGLAYLALVASVLAFSIYYSLLRSIGPARAAYTSVLIPVLAMALSTQFEGYRWTPIAVAGALLAMIGMVIALRGRSA